MPRDRGRGGPARANTRVLLVEANPVEGALLRSWLEESGFDVTVCTGPPAPTYVCIGDRSGSCPLVEESDVVVLDCRLGGEHVLEGTSAADLLSLYLCAGRPVVALEGEHRSILFRDDEVVFLNEDVEGGLLGAVDRALNGPRIQGGGGPALAGPPPRMLSPG